MDTPLSYAVPRNQTPPPDPPRGLRAERRQIGEIDADTLKALDIPAFLRRQNVELPSAIASARKNSPLTRAPISVTEQSVGATAQVSPPTEERLGNKALSGFLADLDFSGGPVLSRALLAKHGIIIEGESNHSFDMRQALWQLDVLVTAFQEASEYDPVRHHNQPRPALWVSSAEYIADLVALLIELRRLNDHLQKSSKLDKSKEVEKSASFAMVAGKKFIESYVDIMGKGAAALTIGGIAALFISLGVDKGSVETIWNLLKPNK